ncbi:MAG: MBL fold metallo-hydrolase [Desulfosalsimonas sp.]
MKQQSPLGASVSRQCISSPEPTAGLCICMLASGSKGNAIYVASEKTAVLIDAGLSGVQIEGRMQQHGLCPRNLDALVVSHEHNDHVTGVGVLARRYNLPVYINDGTRKAAARHLGRIDTFCPFSCGTRFAVNDLVFRPFSVSHDAAAPAGFTVENNAGKIGIATDLGVATAMVRHHLQGCDLLVPEANHDVPMLEQGPYPWPTKQRIKGRTGHLSNESARDLLMEIIHERLQHVVLAHISQTNNTPEKALSVVAGAVNGKGPGFSAARQDACGRMFEIKKPS